MLHWGGIWLAFCAFGAGGMEKEELLEMGAGRGFTRMGAGRRVSRRLSRIRTQIGADFWLKHA